MFSDRPGQFTSMEQTGLITRDVCNGFAGDAELYGLGIRIGIYLQWMSSLLTNIFLPYGVSDSLDTNSIFLFALFIATASSTNARGGLHPTEGFIILQLCFGFLLSVLSIGGWRLTLFSDLDPKLQLPKFRLNDDLNNSLHNLRQEFERVEIPPPHDFGARPRLRVWLGECTRKRIKIPPGLAISKFLQFWLMAIDLLAVSSFYLELFGSCDIYAFLLSSCLEPSLWIIDFSIFFLLSDFRTHETSIDPVSSYLKERLLRYKKIRSLARKLMSPRIFSLGLSSIYKNDQISWLGIVWRICIVAGIGIYNVWFWFTGIEFLRTDSCPKYVFLFCKANMSGGVRTFFKVMSIVYVIYGGVLTLGCFVVIIALIQTTCRSLIINFLFMPYAKAVLLMARTDNSRAQQWLKTFDVTRSEFLKWLDLPDIRQLLCGYAYLSSNPKETVVIKETGQSEENPSQHSAW